MSRQTQLRGSRRQCATLPAWPPWLPRPRASFGFGPGHDEKRHADDFARLDPFRAAPPTFGFEPVKGSIELIVVNVAHSAALVRDLFEFKRLLLPGG